jgi:hypothetical protein
VLSPQTLLNSSFWSLSWLSYCDFWTIMCYCIVWCYSFYSKICGKKHLGSDIILWMTVWCFILNWIKLCFT